MKRILSLVFALVLMVSLMPSAAATSTQYIPAPYAIEDPTKGPTEYLEPVFYENADGPTIGITLVGAIKEGDLYFKDSDNDQELDAFEDWRLSTTTRVSDLLTKLSINQRAGMLGIGLTYSPVVETGAEAFDENGKVLLSKLINITEDDALSLDAYSSNGADWSYWLDAPSTGVICGAENRSGVNRKNTDTEAGALFSNALNMVSEYGAVAKNQPMIPYTQVSNPLPGNYPSNLGMAAAAMGDGNYEMIKKSAELDRQIWAAKGINEMYGPQIDLITDPRWARNATTYTEDPEVLSGIVTALVEGYQTGEDGKLQTGDVGLIVKHFPGDGAADNGLVDTNALGQSRVYATDGSLAKYHLPAFQAAIDAGAAGVMPSYSRPTLDGRSVPQSYRGININTEEKATAFNRTILQNLLGEAMGFDGFINSDSNIISSIFYGVEELSKPERIAVAVNAGNDVIGDEMKDPNYADIREAVSTGLIDQKSLDRATTKRLAPIFDRGQFENPYLDHLESKAVGEKLAAEIAALQDEAQHKSVVLMKNHDNALPINDTTKKVYIASFSVTGESAEQAEADLWDAFSASGKTAKELFKYEFSSLGFTLVEKPEEADIALLDVVPGGVDASNGFVSVLDLVDNGDVELIDPETNLGSGNFTEVTTLRDVKKIAVIAKAVHDNGGVVIASVDISSPWILTNLEPYCDALIGSFTTSVRARMDVFTGTYNPTGKLPITMVSCNDVIELSQQEINGRVWEVCASPNDVPGYDKDQHIDTSILEKSPSGSYAYMDTDGNIYKAWHGLSY